MNLLNCLTSFFPQQILSAVLSHNTPVHKPVAKHHSFLSFGFRVCFRTWKYARCSSDKITIAAVTAAFSVSCWKADLVSTAAAVIATARIDKRLHEFLLVFQLAVFTQIVPHVSRLRLFRKVLRYFDQLVSLRPWVFQYNCNLVFSRFHCLDYCFITPA